MTDEEYWYDCNVSDGGVTPPRPARGPQWNHGAPSFGINIDRPYRWSDPCGE